MDYVCGMLESLVRIEVVVSKALTLPEETPVDTEVKVPVSSSGDRICAKNAGVSHVVE